MGRSPGFGSAPNNWVAHFALGFPAAPPQRGLASLSRATRRLIMQKARGQAFPLRGIALPPLVGARFQALIPPLFGVLFTFRSRYWFTIGRQDVLSLGRWSSRIPAGFPGPGRTWEHRRERPRLSPTGLSPSVAGPSRPIRLGEPFVTPRGLRTGPWRVPQPRRHNARGLERVDGLG